MGLFLLIYSYYGRIKRTSLLLRLLLLLIAATLPSFAEKVATIPAPTGYIDDYADVFSSPAKSEMEDLSRELHNKTKAQVFVVTVNTTEGEPVETFANELFAKWKIGEKKTDRGVLMLFAIKDHKRWIEVGYGLEGILNDAKVGDIGRTMVPSLSQGDYNTAIPLGVQQLARIIATDAGVTLNVAQPVHQYHRQAAPIQISLTEIVLGGGAALLILFFLIKTGNMGLIFFLLGNLMGGGGFGGGRGRGRGGDDGGGGFGGFGGGSSGGGGASGDY